MRKNTFIKLKYIMTVSLVVLNFLFYSCIKRDFYQKALSDSDIERMYVGMEIDEVTEHCGPLTPSKLPIFNYPAKDGGKYVFYFIPTNEANRSEKTGEDELSLVAIVKSVETSKGQKDYYVLPLNLFGKKFTGTDINIKEIPRN
ncbi:MAG: hypothetical protein GY749_15015 [Desulfobacteraceae bacterium]|nr:hypothetical protein [Desulfobacteraceae bacterium]MCP4106824.1 hypothetical protein [Desulfobacteraceae bacterium]